MGKQWIDPPLPAVKVKLQETDRISMAHPTQLGAEVFNTLLTRSGLFLTAWNAVHDFETVMLRNCQ
jgi:hypothetical protein